MTTEICLNITIRFQELDKNKNLLGWNGKQHAMLLNFQLPS